MIDELLAKDDDQTDSEQADDNLTDAEETGEKQVNEGPVQSPLSRPAFRWLLFALGGLLVIAVGVLLFQQFGGAALFSTRPPRIAFMSERDGNWEVYIMDRDGSNLVNLTNDPAADGIVVHAARQDRLAFVSDRDEGGLGVFVMDLDGNNVTKIGKLPASMSVPLAWSPDGKYLVINSGQPDSPEILLVELDSEGIVNLTERDDARRFGDWSSKVNRLILSSSTGEGMSLFVTDPEGKQKQFLTDGSYPAGAPQWSPDGQKVVFMATEPGGGPIDIYVVDAAGGEPANLTQSSSNDGFPRWSPDGSKIAFITNRDGNSEIYVMDADGSNQTNLTNSPTDESLQGDFSWSPDGTQILFHSDREGDLEVYVMNADGSNQVNLTNSPGTDFGAIWIE